MTFPILYMEKIKKCPKPPTRSSSAHRISSHVPDFPMRRATFSVWSRSLPPTVNSTVSPRSPTSISNGNAWLTFNSSRHLSYILSLVDHTISSDAGSEVDLTTPPRQDDLPRRRLRRLGTAAAEATLSPVPPDNQKGLDGYPHSMAPQTPTQVQEPEQQETTQEAKPCLSQLVAG